MVQPNNDNYVCVCGTVGYYSDDNYCSEPVFDPPYFKWCIYCTFLPDLERPPPYFRHMHSFPACSFPADGSLKLGE